jgi:hypothetical protein
MFGALKRKMVEGLKRCRASCATPNFDWRTRLALENWRSQLRAPPVDIIGNDEESKIYRFG